MYLFRLAIINFALPQKDDNFGVVSTATDGCGQSTVFGSGGLVFRNIPLNNVAGFRNVIVKMNFQFVERQKIYVYILYVVCTYAGEIVSVKPQIKLSEIPQLLMSLWRIGSSSSSVNGKEEIQGLLHFFHFGDRSGPSNSGQQQHLGLANYTRRPWERNGKKVKNRSSNTQNYAPKMQPFFDLLPSFV